MVKAQEVIQNTIAYLDQQKIYGNELFFRNSLKNNEPVSEKRWQNLNVLEAAVQTCTQCRLAGKSKRKVVGKGNHKSNIMVISDSPALLKNNNKELDLLIKILAAIEFTPEDVYMTSIIKCDLSLKRYPLHDEISGCMPFLWGQIELCAPKILLVLGETAGSALLGVKKDMSELRKNNYYTIKDACVFVTYHPAVLVNSSDPDQQKNKRWVWEDVKHLRSRYDNLVEGQT